MLVWPGMLAVTATPLPIAAAATSGTATTARNDDILRSGLDTGGQRQAAAVAATSQNMCTVAGWKSTWRSVNTANGKARVWWNPAVKGIGRSDAAELAQDLNRTIWPKLTKLMGAPRSDQGGRLPCRGGDARLDVLLLKNIPRFTGDGLTVPLDSPTGTSVFIMVRDMGSKQLRGVLAHEFMHATQLAYRYAKPWQTYQWLEEATATWAMDYAFPSDDVEQQVYAPDRIMYPLDQPHRGLSAYTFPFYVAGRHGSNAGVIRSIWNGTASRDALGALNAALPKGIAGAWPGYAMAYWNAPPVTTFRDWDGLVGGMAGAEPPDELTVGGADSVKLPVNVTVEPLTAIYVPLHVNDDVRGVRFTSSVSGAKPNAHVTALLKNSLGQWLPPADWTSGGNFCRDTRDIRSMVLILSNGNPAGQSAAAPLDFKDSRIRLDRSCNPKTVTGRLAVTVTGRDEGADGGYLRSDESGTLDINLVRRVQYDNTTTDYIDAGSRLVSSSWQEQMYGPCTSETNPGSYQLTGSASGPFDGAGVLTTGLPGGTRFLVGWSYPENIGTYVQHWSFCDGSSDVYTDTYAPLGAPPCELEQPVTVGPDGRPARLSLDMTCTNNSSDGMTWSFRATGVLTFGYDYAT